MNGKAARRQMNAKRLIVLMCLLMVANMVHATVLCSGSDGHVKFESAFHERCDGDSHSKDADPENVSNEVSKADDHHCEPCVDLPVPIGLAAIPSASKLLNPTFVSQAANAAATATKVSSSSFDAAWHDSQATSYFSPLRTVILLA